MATLRFHQPDPLPAASAAPQYLGIDALRSAAALSVVLLHACVPYLRTPMPGLLWPVQDTPSSIADPLFWGIEVFVMPVFLALAGFFLWRSARSRSPGELLGSRARRLLIPLLFGILVVLPFDLYIWTLGLVTEGVVSPVKLKSLKFDSPISDQIWGLSHLWFLQYVFLYVAMICFCLHRGWITPTSQQGQKSSARLGGLACLILAAFLSLWMAPEVVWGFQHSFFPVASKFIYSGAFFAFGWWLAGNEQYIHQCEHHWKRLAGLSAVALSIAVMMGLWFLRSEMDQSVSLQAKFCLVASTVAAASLITFTLLTLVLGQSTSSHLPGRTGLVVPRRIARAIGYLSAGSFWLYLVHHPLLGLIHLDLKWMLPELPSTVKLLASFTIACGLSLTGYEFLVRRTRLGSWLGFAKTAPQTTESRDSEDMEQVSLPIRPRTEEPRRRAA